MAKPRFVDWNRFSYLLGRAIAAGVPLAVHGMRWDVSQGCNTPYMVTIGSNPPEGAIKPIEAIREGDVRFLDIDTPCRKCEVCRKNRQMLWRRRIRIEYASAPRTWSLTFTINPHERFKFSLRSGSRDFMASHALISKELTKYFKRLRKSGLKFRYVLVTEAHKDGYPHYHALVHEKSTPISKRSLQAQWHYGFTTCKLVKDLKGAYYIAKYLAKDARTRIRASEHYGQSGLEHLAFLDELRLSGSIPQKTALAHRIL